MPDSTKNKDPASSNPCLEICIAQGLTANKNVAKLERIVDLKSLFTIKKTIRTENEPKIADGNLSTNMFNPNIFTKGTSRYV